MAGAGYKQFADGDVLTAAQVQTFLQDQAVMKFADSSARTTGLGTAVAEGMLSYLADTDAVEVYDGSAWAVVGAQFVKQAQSVLKIDNFSTTSTSFTPVTGLSVSITPSDATSRILVMAGVLYGVSTGSSTLCSLAMKRDSTYIGGRTTTPTDAFSSVDGLGSYARHSTTGTLLLVDSPATTSAVTYQVEIKTGAGTAYVNQSSGQSNGTSQIVVLEIGA